MQSAAEGGPTDTYYDYICVVDFEATCEEDNPSDYLHEIIEFPMVLISTHTLEIVRWICDEGRIVLLLICRIACNDFTFIIQVHTFQAYVKPELNPQLSDFCVKLTGITQVSRLSRPTCWIAAISGSHLNSVFYCFVGQKMVDEADPFPAVLQKVVAWLQERELGTKYKYAILTDGYGWISSEFTSLYWPFKWPNLCFVCVFKGPGTWANSLTYSVA